MAHSETSQAVGAAVAESTDAGVALWRIPDAEVPDRLELEWANPNVKRTLGIDLRAHIGQCWRDLATPVPPEEIAQYRALAATGGAILHRPLRPAPGGVASRLSAIALSGHRLVTVFHHDAADTDALRNQDLALFLESILENFPAMVFVKDARELRFVRFNRAGEQLLGVERSQLIGRSDYDLFPADQADAFTSKDREVLQGREIVDIAEEPIQTAAGERWLHTMKVPVVGTDGEPQYLLGISYEITEDRHHRTALRVAHHELERRVAERTVELEEANAALRRQITDREHTEAALLNAEDRYRQAQKMEAIGRLAGGIAHDFNNLMSVVVGYAAMMLDDMGRADPHRGELEQIQFAGERAASLTRQLLAFSRQQVLEPRVVDLNRIVTQMSSMIARLLGEDVELATALAENLPPVVVDPNQMEQVIMNLVVNARDAMPKGGTLTLTTALQTRADFGPTGRVMLSVADTGHGIPPEIRARIFDPFFTTKDVGKGTGLGLSTVFGIVEQSGGTVELTSAVDEGARFELFFPPVDERPEVEAPMPRAPSGRETILLVEDDEMGRTVAKRMLVRLGYRVRDVSSARDALALLRAEPNIDLVLADVVMPHTSGLELAQTVAAERPEMRFVLMSGYSEDLVAQHSLPAGHVAFIQKPLSPELVGRTLRRVLDAALPALP